MIKILFPYMARWKAVNWTRYHSLLTCIAEMGHDVFVLQPPGLNSLETNFQEIEIDLPDKLHLIEVRIPAWIWRRRFPMDKLVKKGLYSLFSLRVAWRIVREEKIDLLFLYNIPQYPYLRLKVPFKAFDYADDYIAMLAHELGPLKNSIFMSLGKKLLERMVNRSDLVLAVSNVLVKKFSAKVKVLPNGVNLEKVEYAKKYPMNLKLQRPVVGFIGSFEYFIDLDLILDVAGTLPEITFLIVGSGRLWDYVKTQAALRKLKNMVLPGGASHKDIFRYIGQMDICLNIFKKIPISHGACPIKLFEYLSMMKPVISTRLEELKYIDKGFLFYGDNTEEVVGCIRQLIANETLRKAKATAGYEETVGRYTWQNIAKEFLEKINDIK